MAEQAIKKLDEIHEILDVRKAELIAQLNHMTQEKLNDLATQRNHLETIQAQLSSCLDLVNESLTTDDHEEVLKMKTTITKQVKEMTTPFQPDLLKPDAEADMAFSDCISVHTRKYGKVFTLGSPDPSNCHATGKDLEVAMAGRESSIILQANNYNGEPCEKPIMSLQCELVSEITLDTMRGSVENRGQSQYKIIYKPTIKGRHQLHIKVEDQHIKGSPFAITAKLPLEKIGTSILTIGGVNGPWGVAFNQKGEVVVTEFGEHCVSVFSPSGERLQSFGMRGSGQGQFIHPCGVAVDGEGNILVVDSNNHRIQQFTAEGQFITSVGTFGNEPLQFNYPRGITFNASNNKVYVAEGNNHVQVLNSDLTFSTSFVMQGNSNGQFDIPRDIFCDSTGKVYIADFYNNHIQVFTAEGKFLRMFGRRGDERGELDSPTCITIDSNNRVYVGDCSDCVSVFTSDGQFLTTFGREGKEPGEFNSPRGLVEDASGVLYVCDYGNNRIQVF